MLGLDGGVFAAAFAALAVNAAELKTSAVNIPVPSASAGAFGFCPLPVVGD